MPDYRKMYTILFNAITDALECIQQDDYNTAKDILIYAQKTTEEIYISE